MLTPTIERGSIFRPPDACTTPRSIRAVMFFSMLAAGMPP
jgi:hypothetical protein